MLGVRNDVQEHLKQLVLVRQSLGEVPGALMSNSYVAHPSFLALQVQGLLKDVCWVQVLLAGLMLPGEREKVLYYSCRPPSASRCILST